MEEKQPLYKQISQEIIDTYKHLEYYDALPGERELCDIFKTSRPTLRKAMDIIEKQGIITRIPGKGTFYTGNNTHVDHQLNTVIGLFNDSKLQGKSVTSKVLVQNVETPTKSIALKLNIDSDDLIFHLERLRYIDNELYSLCNSYHPYQRCAGLRDVDFTNTSLYSTLEQMGITLDHMDQVLEVKRASKYEALQLGIEENDPVMVRSSTTYDDQGHVIEYLKEITQAYSSKFEMTVYRK